MPAAETYDDLPFPVGGVDLQTEFQEQPPGTTPSAQNVRALNPDSLRARGGSRAGLARYVKGRIPADATQSLLVQHLAVIVDPQAPALRQNFFVPGSDWVVDPLVPGTYVPSGGWGNPGGAPTDPAAVPLAFVQSAVAGFDNTASQETTNYGTTPGGGSFLWAVVATADAAVNITVAVKNGALAGYAQVGTYQRFVKLGVEFSLSLWWKSAADGASETAVKVTPSSAADLVVAGLEFRGPNASPVGPTASNSGTANPMTTGNVAADAGDAVVGAFLAGLAPDTVTPGAGYTLQVNHDDGTVDATDIQLYVVYRILAAPGTEDPQATFGGGADDFAALALVIED